MVDSNKTSDQEAIERSGASGTMLMCAIGLAFAYAFDATVAIGLTGASRWSNALRGGTFLVFMGLSYFLANCKPNLFRRAFVSATGESGGRFGPTTRMVCLGALVSCSLLAFESLEMLSEQFWVDAVRAAFIAICGFAMGLLQICWNGRVANGFDKPSVVVSTSFVIASVLTLLFAWLDSSALTIAETILPIASALSLAYCRTSGMTDSNPITGQERLLASEGHRVLFAYMMLFGFILGSALDFWSREVTSMALVAASIVSALFRLARGSHRSSIGQMGKIYLPLCVALAFCFVSENGIVMLIASVAAFVAAVMQSVSNVMFLEDLSVRYKIDGIALVSMGRFPSLLGIGAGLVLAATYHSAGVDVPYAFIAPCLLAMIVVLAYALLPFNRGNPMREGVVLDLEEGIVPWLPKGSNSENEFKEKCGSAAREHGLSPRETEILMLLACGYNMTTIAEMLFISTSTVKTHTYRIYQKFGVHSQQEIIVLLGPQHDPLKD